jgi:hypothetical protein
VNRGHRIHFLGRATFILLEVFSDMAPSLFECRSCGTSFIEYDLYIRHEGSCVTRTIVIARDAEPLRGGESREDRQDRDLES